MKIEPCVAILVLNWNKKEFVINLLHTLTSINYSNYDIIVVDNASTDGSVEAIQKFSHVNLIVNESNIGGTGGFNTGMKYVLEKKQHNYIWLLDNDATVTPDSLNELVDTMENDQSIGLAGSRILNVYKPEYVVETGAKFDWQAGTVRPIDRNVLKSQSNCTGPIEVDYVAICSALVRVTALVDVGLMDERYFLFWDDMDWGISFKQRGYKVVAVPKSEIFHAAFTEYRSVVVDSYYGVRNQLLTFSKYNYHKGARIGLFHQVRRTAKGGLLMLLRNKPGGKLGFLGFWDFLRGHWGKIPWTFSPTTKEGRNQRISLPKNAKVLVITTQDADSTETVVNFLWKNGAAKVVILVPEDRKALFSGSHYSQLIAIDYFGGSVTWNTWKIFCQLMGERFDISVKSSPEKVSPFSYAIKDSAWYAQDDEALVLTKESRGQIWQVVFASFFGELLGIGMYVIAWLRGLFYTQPPHRLIR